MIERLLHKKCYSATVDQIPSKYGVSIVQKWKHFVAIPIAGRRAALGVYDTCYPFELFYFKCRFSTDRIKQRSNV